MELICQVTQQVEMAEVATVFRVTLITAMVLLLSAVNLVLAITIRFHLKRKEKSRFHDIIAQFLIFLGLEFIVILLIDVLTCDTISSGQYHIMPVVWYCMSFFAVGATPLLMALSFMVYDIVPIKRRFRDLLKAAAKAAAVAAAFYIAFGVLCVLTSLTTTNTPIYNYGSPLIKTDPTSDPLTMTAWGMTSAPALMRIEPSVQTVVTGVALVSSSWIMFAAIGFNIVYRPLVAVRRWRARPTMMNKTEFVEAIRTIDQRGRQLMRAANTFIFEQAQVDHHRISPKQRRLYSRMMIRVQTTTAELQEDLLFVMQSRKGAYNVIRTYADLGFGFIPLFVSFIGASILLASVITPSPPVAAITRLFGATPLRELLIGAACLAVLITSWRAVYSLWLLGVAPHATPACYVVATTGLSVFACIGLVQILTVTFAPILTGSAIKSIAILTHHCSTTRLIGMAAPLTVMVGGVAGGYRGLVARLPRAPPSAVKKIANNK